MDDLWVKVQWHGEANLECSTGVDFKVCSCYNSNNNGLQVCTPCISRAKFTSFDGIPESSKHGAYGASTSGIKWDREIIGNPLSVQIVCVRLGTVVVRD